MFCTLVFLCIVGLSLSSVVKYFESLKALCKFPIIIIIILPLALFSHSSAYQSPLVPYLAAVLTTVSSEMTVAVIIFRVV